MDRSHLRAKALLSQQLIPGRDQDALRRSIDELGTIISSAQRGTRDYIQGELHLLGDRCMRYLLHPDTKDVRVRAGLEDILYQCKDILADAVSAAREQRFIVGRAEARLQRIGLPAVEFSHIPFSYIRAPDAGRIAAELHRARITATPEKQYRVIALRARSEEPWNLALVGAEEAWKTTRGAGVTCAVVDTGCDYEHHELRARFGAVKGYDFVNDTDAPLDDNGHGTHCSGSVAGQTVGVAPECTLYALKFLDGGGYGYEVDFIRAAEWAIDHGVHVLSGSFGSMHASPPEEAICEALSQHGILFCAAAGNSGTTEYSYPASYESVLSVAAVDRSKDHARFSQRNDRVAISAPGVDVRSAVPGGYDTLSGTSMATPHVAGAMALLRSMRQDPEYVRDLLVRSAEALGAADKYGAGLVRPDAALGMDAFVRTWSGRAA